MCIYSKIGITLYIDNPIIKLVKFEYPNTKAFNKWKVEMEHVYKKKLNKPFRVWLTGNYLIKGGQKKPEVTDTLDIDIIVTKDTNLEKDDYKKVSEFLIESIKCGLNNKIYVDSQFVFNKENTTYEKDGKRSFFIKTGEEIEKAVISKACYFNFNKDKLKEYTKLDRHLFKHKWELKKHRPNNQIECIFSYID